MAPKSALETCFFTPDSLVSIIRETSLRIDKIEMKWRQPLVNGLSIRLPRG